MIEALKIIEKAARELTEEMRFADNELRIKQIYAAQMKLLSIFDCIHNTERMEDKLAIGAFIGSQQFRVLDILDAEIIG